MALVPLNPATRRTALRWDDLGRRVVSAALLAPLGLLGVWRGGLLWSLMLLALTAGLIWEWGSLCRRPVANGLLAPAAGAFLLLVGLAAIVAAALSLAWLRADRVSGMRNVLFLVLVVWASDSGAYLVGRAVGGPRLAPAISPGKTWSGAVGGLAAAIAAALLAAAALDPGRPVWIAAVATALGLAAQAGDLLESWAKRRFGVKDSGGLLPGHGGLLDRLDGLLMAALVAAGLALALGPGVVLWQ